jgi:predicted O-linked N-acetylglucosamine transferase (SPINDLY family)
MSESGPSHDQPFNQAPTAAEAQQCISIGSFDKARELCQQALAAQPELGWPHNFLALIAAMFGDMAAAVSHAKLASERNPEDAGLLVNLARAYAGLGNPTEAFACLAQAIALSPQWPEPLLLRAELEADAGLNAASASTCREAMELFPDNVDCKFILAEALTCLQQTKEAISLMEQVRRARPTSLLDATRAISYWNYLTPAGPTPGEPLAASHLFPDPKLAFDAHRSLAQMLARFHQPAWKPLPRTKSGVQLKDRKLRVGIISPDLRDHSVAFFIEPFFTHYNRESIELFAYSASVKSDRVTDRLKAHADHWRSLADRTRQKLGEAVAADQLDVLIELAGLFRGQVLDIARCQLAPAVCTYLGYPNTTGLKAIGFRIVDSITDPAGAAEAFATERLIHLDPCFVCFQPPESSPPVAPPPCLENGYITFGSFNNVRKLNDPLIALWSMLLQQLPGAKLLLKAAGLGEAAYTDGLLAKFEARGVSRDRIELRDYIADADGHLGAYRSLDIALDPAPYNGTTTTCEAAWMGVPTVTLAGNSHVSRVGASLMRAIGDEHLVANTIDEYVAIASKLASDPASLAAHRQTTRQRVNGSVLCDAPGFCSRFEAALRHAATLSGVN